MTLMPDVVFCAAAMRILGGPPGRRYESLGWRTLKAAGALGWRSIPIIAGLKARAVAVDEMGGALWWMRRVVEIIARCRRGGCSGTYPQTRMV